MVRWIDGYGVSNQAPLYIMCCAVCVMTATLHIRVGKSPGSANDGGGARSERYRAPPFLVTRTIPTIVISSTF